MTEIVSGSLRMMGDRILLRPLDWKASEVIIAIRHGRPVRGEVVAVGPGKWVTRIVTGKRDGKDFRKRYQTRVFLKTEVKPGDIVNIGGLNIFDGAGYMALLEVVVGTETLLIFQEADVAVVENIHEGIKPSDFIPMLKRKAAARLARMELPQVQANG